MANTQIECIVEEHQQQILPYTRQILKDKSVLDIGAGSGLTATLLSEKLKCRFELTDINDLRHASAKRFPFTISSLDSLSYSDNSFDITYLQYVLHHLDSCIDLKKALNEAFRVAKEYMIIVEEVKDDMTDEKKAIQNDIIVNSILHPDMEVPLFTFYTDREIIINLPYNSGIQSYLVSNGTENNGYLKTMVYIVKK